ncbi:hypothetical protein PENTCL1PPCAC_15671, partial [Pristionchus entomophagus]
RLSIFSLSILAMSLVTVCSNIEHVNKVTGIALNILLLYLITTYSRKSLGTYKYLLIVFASSDVILTLVHVCINHQIVSVGSTFACVGYSFFQSRHFTAIYCSSFTLAFSLSIFNFLYRFWAVKYPHLLDLFTNKYFIALLAMVAASTFFSWYLLCVLGTTGGIDEVGTIVARKEYYRRFGRNLTDGFQVLDHWRDGKFNVRAFWVFLACDMMIISCITLAGAFAFLCYYHIQKAEKLSIQSKLLQAKMLLTLCAQTAVPILFVFVPYFAVLSFPFFQIDAHLLNVGCTSLISLFPTCDAIVIIMLMTDYREGLKAMILRRKTSVSMLDSRNTISRIS